jgi:carboxymethylenebutenolidase
MPETTPATKGAYLAEPSQPAGAGVLVIHDWYGLLPHVRAACDELAADLRARLGGGPVGVLGWSLGGMFALLQATTGTVDAAAVYYAALDSDDAAKLRCPVLLHLAETDEFDPPELYDGFVAALRAAGTGVEVHTWPGTEHSFANRDVALHAPAAAAEAWSITLGFLRERLAGGASG